MSYPKKAESNVFRVVDKRGNVHVINADRMFTDGDGVTFHDGSGHNEIASFSHPTAAARSDKSTYTEALELVAGEVCLSAFPAAPRGLVGLTWFVGLVVAVTACLKAYELFWFAG